MALTPEQVREAFNRTKNHFGSGGTVTDKEFKAHFESVMAGDLPSSSAYRSDLLSDNRFKTLVQRNSSSSCHNTAKHLIERGDSVGLQVLHANALEPVSSSDLHEQLKQAASAENWDCVYELCRQGADKNQLTENERSELEAHTEGGADSPLEDMARMHAAELASRVQSNGSLTTNVQRIAKAIHDPADVSGSTSEALQTLFGSQQEYKFGLMQEKMASPVEASEAFLKTQRNLKEMNDDMGLG